VRREESLAEKKRRRCCKCHRIARLVFLVAPAANHRRGGALEGHSAGMEIRGRGFCGALVNRGQSRVLSFFSFPRPRQAPAESEKSRADAPPPKRHPRSQRPSPFHRKRCGSGCLGFAGRACPSLREGRFWSVLFAGIRFIRGFFWNGRGLPLLQRLDTPPRFGKPWKHRTH
jgi:hypothetical protein